jgi:gliding motility-associated-like protein
MTILSQRKLFCQRLQVKIFNRYGNIVFSTIELNKGWDGDFKNTSSPTAEGTAILIR